MKTHIPATLRKALIAALFATASLASTSYARGVEEVGKVVNWSEDYVSPFETCTSKGYTDLTFSGTNRTLGTVHHYVHSAAMDFGGVDSRQRMLHSCVLYHQSPHHPRMHTTAARPSPPKKAQKFEKSLARRGRMRYNTPGRNQAASIHQFNYKHV